MKSLSSKILKNNDGQSIQYKGQEMQVSWGGEWFTAIWNGNEYRGTTLKELKEAVRNNEFIDPTHLG